MTHFTKKLIKLMFVLVILFSVSSTVNAQQDPGETQYRFYVQDVDTREEAKLVHYGLIENPSISWVNYIHDCGCFKINTSLTLDREQLSDILNELGYELSGIMYCGDGRLLPEPVQNSEER